jgi:ferredoxin
MEGGCASCGACVAVCPTGAFKPLAKELLETLLNNVDESGNVYTVSARTQTAREKLGLPPLPEAPIEELKKITEKTRGGEQQ